IPSSSSSSGLSSRATISSKLATAATPDLLARLADRAEAYSQRDPVSDRGEAMAFELPELPYAYDALEPTIDEQTMHLHHDKHHQAYVDNVNKALEKYPDWQKKSVDEILRNISSVPDDVRTAVRNNAGGHYNHTMFW